MLIGLTSESYRTRFHFKPLDRIKKLGIYLQMSISVTPKRIRNEGIYLLTLSTRHAASRNLNVMTFRVQYKNTLEFFC